jgi:hypothetical protein
MIIEFEQLNERQKEAIEVYSKIVAYYMNRKLREDTINKPDFIDYVGYAQTIDSIFTLAPTKPSPQILYRGTQFMDLYNNPIFTEKGFMSTSVNENVAQKHIHKENGVVIKIHLHCSNVKLLEVRSSFEESEYLIPRNTSFKVLYRGEEMNSKTNQLAPCIGVCPIEISSIYL